MSKKKGMKGEATDGNTATMDAERGDLGVISDAIMRPGEGNCTPTAAAEKPAESKSQRFKRLLGDRMPKVLARLRQIKALANRAQYEFSSTQAAWAIAKIHAELEEIAMAFQSGKKEKETLIIPD